MKVSHEVPLCFLKESLEWNDYQYVLPHLIDQYPQYKTHMLEYREKPGSFIICDNGLFEGVTHTTDDLIDKINLIRPDIFIVPDAWNDSTTTIRNAKSWIINGKPILPEDTGLMAVCQGESLGELITTYQTLVDLGYTHIAFNHSSCAYQEMYPTFSGTQPLKAQMYGRMEFIRRLVEKDTIRKDVYHHLLGCSLPQEFNAYKDWDFIKSVDTSNPILVGAEGKRYTDNGIDWKPKEKLEYYFEKDLSGQINDIIFNVHKFKTFIK
jgi:hypothetical protein